MPIDPRAEAATILSQDSQGVIPFAKGERRRQDQLKLAEDRLGAANKRAADKNRSDNLGKLNANYPDYWSHYQNYIGGLQDDFLNKYGQLYNQSPDGNLSLVDERNKQNDMGRLKEISDQSLAMEKALGTATKDINKPIFDNPENRQRLHDITNPGEHAATNGNMKEYEELGPVRYAYDYILGGEPLLRPNTDAAGYVKENFLPQLKEKLATSVVGNHTNAKGGYSKFTTESFDPALIKTALGEYYDTDKTFSNLVNRLAVEEANKTGGEPQEHVDGVLEDLSNQIGYGPRVVKSDTKADPEKDDDFTMRYISSKNGKKTVTDEFRDSVGVDVTVRVGSGLVVRSPYIKQTGDLKISMPSGDFGSGDDNTPDKATGNYGMGTGTLFINTKANSGVPEVWWKGNVTTREGEKVDRMIKASKIDHPEVNAAKEALMIMLEEKNGKSKPKAY